MPAEFTDLAEHTGTLVTLIGVLAVFAGSIIAAVWKLGSKLILTLDAKVEAHLDESAVCKASLPLIYMLKTDAQAQFTELRSRQMELRQDVLPRDYIRVETMKVWEDTMRAGFTTINQSLANLASRLDRLIEKKGDA